MKVNIVYNNIGVIETQQKTITIDIAPFDTQPGKLPLSIFQASGDIPVGVGAGAAGILAGPAVGDVGKVITAIAAGQYGLADPISGIANVVNIILDGGFDFAQRLVAPATFTTVATDKYSADRWRSSSQSASFQYARADGTGQVGLNSQYYGSFQQITNAGKCAIYQVIEGANCVALRGRQVTFSIKIKASAAKTIRMAVMELASTGTIDTVPATFVPTWNANTIDPTFGANLNIVSVQSVSATTSWTQFTVTATLPSTSKNYICALWSDSQFAAADVLYVAEAGLYVGASAPAWTPRPAQQELALCERYCEKWDSFTGLPVCAGFADSTSTFAGTIRYRTPKFATASCSYGSALGDWSIRFTGAGTTVTTVISFPLGTPQGALINATATGTPLTGGQGCLFRASNANAYLLFEAEL